MFLLNFTFTKSFLWEWNSKSYNVFHSKIYYYLFILTFGLILLTSVSLLTNSSPILTNDWISSNFISCLNESVKVNTVNQSSLCPKYISQINNYTSGVSSSYHQHIYSKSPHLTSSSSSSPLLRNKRLSDSHSPPHIIPDLPNLLRFFDRTGLQVLCRAAGNPTPQIRWFSLPTNGRPTTASVDRLFTSGGSSSSSGIIGSTVTPSTSSSSGYAVNYQTIEFQNDENYISELGYSSRVRETPQADHHQEFSSSFTENLLPSSSPSQQQLNTNPVTSNSGSTSATGTITNTNNVMNDIKPNSNNQIIVGNGWLNFTATRSSTMRMVFFCQAENYLGQARSRKMVIHQVPMPDENLKIIYNTFPIKPRQKAVISCQPEQGIFNRFLKVKYWEVYLNKTLISTVDHSYGRFSMINVTKHPELHIRSITEAELTSMEVRCVLQSIVDESVTVERPERGRLQRLQFRFSYAELRSVGSEINILRGSTIELPWAVEGEGRTQVDWYYLNEASRVRQAIALDSSTTTTTTSSGSSSNSNSGSSITTTTSNSSGSGSIRRHTSELPWGTKYELVDGAYGNLRLINLSVTDSGHYIAESVHLGRSLRIKYTIRVRGPLGVKITPNRRTVDWGSRVELTCEVTGHPRQLIYWLHNSRLVPRRHHVRHIPTSFTSSTGINYNNNSPLNSISERLIIEAFNLDDIGVYQCIVENGHPTDRFSLSMNGRQSSDDSIFSYYANTMPLSTMMNSQNNTHTTTTTNNNNNNNSSNNSSTSIKPNTDPLTDNDITSQTTSFSSLESVGDLIDNAQATALLMMGKMRPSLTWQNPAVELGSLASQVLLSLHMGTTDALLECRFAANPPPQIIWYRDDQPVIFDDSNVLSGQVMLDEGTACTTITRLTINIRKLQNLDDMWTFGGEYRAVAENSYGQADCRTYVLMDTPLRLRPMDIGKPAIAGRAYTLKCYFIGSGIPTLQWHRIKNGHDVRRIPVDHRHQLLENGRVLRITEVNQEEDEADYRCTANLGDMTANTTVSLKVSHAPRLFELPQTRQVKDGRDMLSYSCALQNRADKPWYAWWEFQREGTNAIVPLPPFKKNAYDGFSVSYVVSENEAVPWRLPDSLRERVPSFVHTEPNSAVHVSVNELRKDQHHGNLTCVVVNEVGTDRQSIRVTFIPELEFAIRPPNNQDVTLGQTISIDCAAKPSDLQPVVEWKYLQKTTGSYVSVSQLSEVTNGRIGQLSNGTLLLSNVDESDPREFLCFLKPGRLSTAAQRSSAVNLEVHVPARIDPLDAVEKVRGSRFNLTCSVYGDPDDLKASWYYRLSSKSRWQIIDKPCVVPLAYVDGVTRSSSGSTQRVGDGVTLEPFKTDDNIFSDLRDLSFDPSDKSSSSPSTEFNRDWSPSLADCQSYATEGLESGILFRQVNKQLQFLNLKEVHMGEYLCKASNKYNRNSRGQPIEVEAFVRLTVISVPDSVQFVYNSSRTTATSVSFSWLPPLRDGNKPIRQYRIRYSHSEPSANGPMSSIQQPNVTEIDVSENQHHIELNNLRPYTKYHITVAAINDVGPSAENALALTTQEAKPDGPVRRLIANGTASDTIIVSWDNPALEHLNGNVDRYWICRQRIKDSLSIEELTELPWPEDPNDEHSTSMRGRYSRVHCNLIIRQMDHEINGLPKFTAYAFRVIAMNSKGLSPPAYTQTRTLEDLPQAPPADVTCASQQHSITVSWNPPNPDTINGILTEYHVSYFAANEYGDETSSVNQAVKGQTTVTLAGLLAYTNYTIQVAVSNRKGRGPSSPRIICLTKEAPPGAPEFVKVKPINSSCIVVSWSHPRKPQGQMKSYCLEAIPLLDTSQDGFVSLFAYPPISPSSSSSYNSNDNNNDRAKGPCIRPDFTSSYNYYFYCGLIEERPYNISVRGINQFDGHKTWAGPVRPTANPPIGIISIGGKIIAQNKMSIWMDCLIIGGYQPHWIYPHDDLEDLHIMDNGTLVVESARVAHSGHYKCSTVSDSISYELLVQEPPRKPIWHKFTPSLRGIQAEWLSPGSKRLDAPILWFYLNWTNLHTGQMETIRLSADQRTYYLSNLTCATTVKFQLKAENKVGNSSLTDVTSWTTLGSSPLTANAAQLIPNHLRQQYSVTFNLSNFLPGNGCPPSTYRLLIAPSEDGHFGLKQTIINQTLTRLDLITVDILNRERCCYNVTNLNSGAHYHYKVVATNAAGSASVQGQFWTRTVSGREPVLKQIHLLGKANFFLQPTVIVPTTALFAIIIVVIIALIFFCRHRRLEEDLCPNKSITVTHNDLRSNQKNNLQHQQTTNIGHSYHSYHVGGGGGGGGGGDPRRVPTSTTNICKGRSSSNHGHDNLPPIPSSGHQQYDTKATTNVPVGRHKTGLKSWLNGTRIRLYDRGHPVKSPEQSVHIGSSQVNNHITGDEDERLSTNSVDSEGNINPYATYAATGFGDRTDTVGTSANLTGPAVPGSGGVKSSVVSGSVIDNNMIGPRGVRSTRDLNMNHNVNISKPSWNTVFRRGLSIPSNAESMITTMSGHHYHYPNLDSSIGNSTLGRPHLIRVGSSGRLRLAQHMIDPRLVPPSTAALIDPMMLGPYDNGTLEGNDSENTVDEFVARGSVLGPLRNGMIRRINSFESLHQLPRGRSQTYHQGFAACIPGGRTLPSMGINVSGSIVGPNASVSFYESGGTSGIQPSDPSVAYRGSVLSSTTVSSNHEELMQAYEYGRKHQLKSCLTLPSNTVIPPHLVPSGNLGTHLIPTHIGIGLDHSHHHRHRQHHHPSTGAAVPHSTLSGVTVGGIGEGEISGESASSDATDSGIRQFTQQPPQPDEARHATCEIPFVYDVNQLNSRRVVPVVGGTSIHRGNETSLFGLSRTKSNSNRLQQQSRFVRCNSDCPSDMTDTYATVDYNGITSGTIIPPPYNLSSTQQNSIRINQLTTTGVGGIQKNLYEQKMDSNVIPRSYQPLPAPPLSTIAYCDTDDPSTAYGPITTTTYDDESDQCQPTSYYYHHHHHHPSSSGMNIMPSFNNNSSNKKLISGFNNPLPSHQIVGSDSNQMRRRVLPINLSTNTRDLRKQSTSNNRINNNRHLDKLHTRQLSEITGEESVGLLSVAGMSNLSNPNPIDICNSTVHGQVYTTTNATTTSTATVNTGARWNKISTNIINSSNGINYHDGDIDCSGGGGGGVGGSGGGSGVGTVGYQGNSSSTITTHHPTEPIEENVYTSEFVLV
uniref:Putative cell adhesion molecule n=1 Tax=Schistosoma mansoni TaxID=6183 RepID=A0A5K4EWD3_SCHMA